MGDFCSLTITVRQCDEKATAAALLLDDDYEADIEAAEPSTEHLSTFILEQAYYAMEDERRALAAAGIPFYGSHGPGDFDPGYAFAACDRTMLEVPMLGNREDLGVPCDWDTGFPDPIRLARVRDYIALRKRVEALFTLTKEPQS